MALCLIATTEDTFRGTQVTHFSPFITTIQLIFLRLFATIILSEIQVYKYET